MAQTMFYFTGIAKWAKLFEPDRKYKNYAIDIYLDKESLKRFRDSGLQSTLKKDDDGQFVTFRRATQKLIKDELVKFGPPEVLGKDNKPINDFVGNGSKVTIKVLAYDTQKGKGSRLEAVRVDDLVPFIKEEVVGADEIEGLPF